MKTFIKGKRQLKLFPFDNWSAFILISAMILDTPADFIVGKMWLSLVLSF